jgi:hypothetical protein
MRARLFLLAAPLAACNAIAGLDATFSENRCYPGDPSTCGDASSDATLSAESGSDGGIDGGGADGWADAAQGEAGFDGGAADGDGGPAEAGPSCAELRWPAVVSAPIVPPWQMGGLDIRGVNDAGLTYAQALAANCPGLVPDGGDSTGGFAGGAVVAWGNAGQVQLSYDVASGRWESLDVSSGYTGALDFKSADGLHQYRATVGAPLTKDGSPLHVDWSSDAAARTTMTEIYNALIATFAPLSAQLPSCATPSCLFVPNSGGDAYLVARPLRMGMESTISDGTFTPLFIYFILTPTYNDLTVDANWSRLDLRSVAPSVPADAGYAGIESDGQYLYFVPGVPGTPVLRYDTNVPTAFKAASAWGSFDMTQVDKGASSFLGGAYDYRHVYFAPAKNGVVAQYDTTALFDAPSSWATFDTTKLVPPASSFAGALYDDYQVVFIPGADGVVAYYDPSSAFGATAAWSTQDLTTIDARLKQFRGGVYAHGRIYLVPHGVGPSFPGLAARSIPVSGSWETFDLATLGASAAGSIAFSTAVYDGTRFIYYVPADTGTTITTLVRYDTTMAFTATAAWSFDQEYASNTTGAWDRRYVYLSGASSTILRYDSLAPFPPSTSLDQYSLPFGDFLGSMFDGRYVYFVQRAGTHVGRFDAAFPPLAASQASSL